LSFWRFEVRHFKNPDDKRSGHLVWKNPKSQFSIPSIWSLEELRKENSRKDHGHPTGGHMAVIEVLGKSPKGHFDTSATGRCRGESSELLTIES
jgi:hypothetical protein